VLQPGRSERKEDLSNERWALDAQKNFLGMETMRLEKDQRKRKRGEPGTLGLLGHEDACQRYEGGGCAVAQGQSLGGEEKTGEVVGQVRRFSLKRMDLGEC